MRLTTLRHISWCTLAEPAARGDTVSDLFSESWGAGTPVVLAHGSLATGAEEWEAQRPLADEGFRLLVGRSGQPPAGPLVRLDRAGHAGTAPAQLRPRASSRRDLRRGSCRDDLPKAVEVEMRLQRVGDAIEAGLAGRRELHT